LGTEGVVGIAIKPLARWSDYHNAFSINTFAHALTCNETDRTFSIQSHVDFER